MASLLSTKINKLYHYCPVKVDESFFEITELKSFTSIFKSARI